MLHFDVLHSNRIEINIPSKVRAFFTVVNILTGKESLLGPGKALSQPGMVAIGLNVLKSPTKKTGAVSV
jgi:hypothetical protein